MVKPPKIQTETLPDDDTAEGREIPDANVRFFDTGHFALETHVYEIAESIRDFLK